MYADIILDYYKNPRNYGKIQKHDAAARDTNPLCGDDIEIQIKIKNSRISDIKFNGHGCAISLAAASMLTEMATGKTLADIKEITPDDMIKMLGIQLSHVRIKCALLSLKVLKLAVYKYLGQKMDEEIM